jgi:hypothetical protein
VSFRTSKFPRGYACTVDLIKQTNINNVYVKTPKSFKIWFRTELIIYFWWRYCHLQFENHKIYNTKKSLKLVNRAEKQHQHPRYRPNSGHGDCCSSVESSKIKIRACHAIKLNVFTFFFSWIPRRPNFYFRRFDWETATTSSGVCFCKVYSIYLSDATARQSAVNLALLYVASRYGGFR